MLKTLVLFALCIAQGVAQVTLEARIVDSPDVGRYIEYINNEVDGYFLERGELTGKRFRVMIKDLPPRSEWEVHFTRNMNQPFRPMGICPFEADGEIYFELPLRATNYFFTVKYIVH